jgi:hypothetical protein
MKKKIPLAILEALQPLVDGNLELVKPVKNENVIFHLVDNDRESDFFYQVVRQELSGGNSGYIVEFQPRNKEDVSKYKVWLKLNEVISTVQSWLSLISAYNKIQTVYDDPIIKSSQERFEKQFDILDEDATYASFDLNQQLYLDDYLNNARTKLLELKDGKTENEVVDLSELEIEVTEIQKNLTKETKKEIIKRLARFWAKSQKAGLDVIKEIFIKVTVELASKLLTNGQ